MNYDKIKNELRWKRLYYLEKGIEITIDWYINNIEWIRNIKQKDYKNWYKKNYEER